jgi:hypothetical protein
MPEIVTSTLVVAPEGIASEGVASDPKVISLWLFTGKLT